MQISGPANTGKIQADSQLPQTLSVGGQYRALVTAARAGQVEILLGNRYLTASTVLPLTSGQTLLLELIADGPEGLVFRLLQGSGEPLRSSENDAVLLKAAGANVDQRSQEALALLAKHSIPASLTSLRQISLLLQELGLQRSSAFMPEFRAFLARGLNLPDSVLLQLAYTATANSAGEALAPYGQPQGRRNQRERRAPARQQTAFVDAATLDAPDALRDAVAATVGSPEHAILIALVENAGASAALTELPVLPDHAPASDAFSGQQRWAEAQRIRAATDPEALRFVLPLSMDGEASALGWEQHALGDDYYEREQLLRLRLLNDTQGRVDIMLHTKGNALRLDISSEAQPVIDAYRAELAQLLAELEELGVTVSSCTVSRTSLPL